MVSSTEPPPMTPAEQTASEYLSMHVYPTLEPVSEVFIFTGILLRVCTRMATTRAERELRRSSHASICFLGCIATFLVDRKYYMQGLAELLKLAFPPEEFGRVAQPPPISAAPSAPSEPAAEDGEEGMEPSAEGEVAASKSHSQPPSIPEPVQAVPEASTGNFPGGKPLIWLAQYLKARNKKNTRETAERNFEAALELAGKDAETLNEHYSNVFAAIRHLLWPCSAYISRRLVITREIPRPPEPPKAEGEDEEQPAEGEEEEGVEKPPPPSPEYEDVEILQYVATSHPMGVDAIEGWTLEYATQGVTGRVMDGEPLLIPDVGAEPSLHWFARKPSRLLGSYYALPLLDSEGGVWGVLSLDTVLDGRMLSGRDTDKLQAIAQRANPVLIDVLSKIPPTPEPETEEEETAPEGGEDEEGGGEEGGG